MCLALIVGCSSKNDATTCEPGTTQDCVGPGDCTGQRTCEPDGSGYSDCNCGGGPACADSDPLTADFTKSTDNYRFEFVNVVPLVPAASLNEWLVFVYDSAGLPTTGLTFTVEQTEQASGLPAELPPAILTGANEERFTAILTFPTEGLWSVGLTASGGREGPETLPLLVCVGPSQRIACGSTSQGSSLEGSYCELNPLDFTGVRAELDSSSNRLTVDYFVSDFGGDHSVGFNSVVIRVEGDMVTLAPGLEIDLRTEAAEILLREPDGFNFLTNDLDPAATSSVSLTEYSPGGAIAGSFTLTLASGKLLSGSFSTSLAGN